MMRHAFLIWDRYGLQAGQSSTRTLCLWSHAARLCRMRPGIVLLKFLGKVIILTAAYVAPKFQHVSKSMVPSHICRSPMPWMHWCTPIPSQRLFFALFIGNSLWSFSSLTHRIGCKFFQKTSWNVDSSDQRTRFHCLLVYLRLLCTHRTWRHFCAKLIHLLIILLPNTISNCISWCSSGLCSMTMIC